MHTLHGMKRSANSAVVILLGLGILGCVDRQEPATAQVAQTGSSTEQGANSRQIIKLTPEAVTRLRIAQRDDGKKYLRVAVVSGGTTGFMYDLRFDNALDLDNDYIDDVEGIKVIVDKRSSLFLDGATIDWQTTPDGREGFHFENPNAVK